MQNSGILSRKSADFRRKVARFLLWARKIAIFRQIRGLLGLAQVPPGGTDLSRRRALFSACAQAFLMEWSSQAAERPLRCGSVCDVGESSEKQIDSLRSPKGLGSPSLLVANRMLAVLLFLHPMSLVDGSLPATRICRHRIWRNLEQPGHALFFLALCLRSFVVCCVCRLFFSPFCGSKTDHSRLAQGRGSYPPFRL